MKKTKIKYKGKLKSYMQWPVVFLVILVIMNVAVVIGIMPTTGLPLPFFSAGGTSISILMGAAALVMNISANERGRLDGGAYT